MLIIIVTRAVTVDNRMRLNMRILIIGAVVAGRSAATKIIRNNENVMLKTILYLTLTAACLIILEEKFKMLIN
ncbi:hypothetical protein SDC9_53593 [bioreactor metagenome]|uniref:Uncharacterized protein n=2 Tax=root TaxID=1 RepID=A0A644WUC9_9ZZZZ